MIERRLERGATTLARMAARDLADFVPGLDTPVIRRALGDRSSDRARSAVDEGADRRAAGSAADARRRSSRGSRVPTTTRSPPPISSPRSGGARWCRRRRIATRTRPAPCSRSAFALAQYFAEASVAPTPIAGAYRHIATEALHLVRRSRYQIEPTAIRALLGCSSSWRRRRSGCSIRGSCASSARSISKPSTARYLEAITQGLPTVQRLLRGDERIGWELRFAHDLAADPSHVRAGGDAVRACVRAVEAGGAALAWSVAAQNATASAGAPRRPLDRRAREPDRRVCAVALARARAVLHQASRRTASPRHAAR